jgi:cytochrome P450
VTEVESKLRLAADGPAPRIENERGVVMTDAAVGQIKVRSEAADLQSTPVASLQQISDYDEIVEVMRSRKFVQGSHLEVRKTIMKDVLITLDGKPHLQRRNVLNQILNDSAIADMRRLHLMPAVERCIAEVKALPADKDGVIATDLAGLVQRCVYRMAAAVAGIDGVDDIASADRLIAYIKSITAGFTVEWSKEPKEKVVARAAADQQAFYKEFFASSQARRAAAVERFQKGECDKSELPLDALTLMLLHKGEAWPDDESLRLREVCLFLTGGSQTTANGFSLFVLLLEDWLERHPEDRPLVLGDPNFLRRAVFESLRVSATVPARLRTATEDVTLASGRQIKKGENVALLSIPANMANEKMFGDDADQFNPHRKGDGLAPWGLTFGTGGHMCPGRPLVTGGRTMKAETEIDGSMVSMARAFYGAGMRLDRRGVPKQEAGSHYNNFASVPVTFSF